MQQQLQDRSDHDPNSLLQRYQHASMTDYHKIKFNISEGFPTHDKYRALVHQITANGPRIEGITSLDFCVPKNPTHYRSESNVWQTLPYLFPSLREIDLTNTVADNMRVVRAFFKNCRRLEKITYLNKERHCRLDLNGSDMKRGKNLKEIYMDNSSFIF